jgi:hypothetical protein
MNMRIIIFLVMLMVGLAGAIEDLSGTDPDIFQTEQFKDDGIAAGAGGSDLPKGLTDFLADGNETNATIPGMKKALVGSMVGYHPPDVQYLTPAELQNRTAT